MSHWGNSENSSLYARQGINISLASGLEDKMFMDGLPVGEHSVISSCEGCAKEEVYPTKPGNMFELEDRITSVLNTVPANMLRAALANIPVQFRKCAENAEVMCKSGAPNPSSVLFYLQFVSIN
jgi:hypothetical protein